MPVQPQEDVENDEQLENEEKELPPSPPMDEGNTQDFANDKLCFYDSDDEEEYQPMPNENIINNDEEYGLDMLYDNALHDDPLCSLDDKSLYGDSIQNYVVMFNFNACNYYERGRDKNTLYVSMLFKMQAIDYYMHWLPQVCCYLFIYKTPMHRKRVRLKSKLFNILWCVPYALMSYSV